MRGKVAVQVSIMVQRGSLQPTFPLLYLLPTTPERLGILLNQPVRFVEQQLT